MKTLNALLELFGIFIVAVLLPVGIFVAGYIIGTM